MSIKIYNAWRFPTERLNELLRAARFVTMRRIFEKHQSIIKSIKTDHFDSAHSASQYLIRSYVHASGEAAYDPISIDASINLWIDGKWTYCITYGMAELPGRPWIEDYHYQNQGDRPKRISNKAWNARRQLWERIALNDWNGTRLNYAIADFAGSLDYDLIGRLHKISNRVLKDKKFGQPKDIELELPHSKAKVTITGEAGEWRKVVVPAGTYGEYDLRMLAKMADVLSW